MNIVYIVTEGSYSDCRNVGVFTTREKAEAAASEGSDSNIEEWILDNQQGAPGHYAYFFVVMARDGTSRRIQKTLYLGTAPEKPKVCDMDRVSKEPEGFVLGFSVWATDVAHAVKIVNEKRVQMIALNQW